MKPGPFLGFMAYGLRKGGLRTKPITDLATIDGDATLDLPGSPRVIPMPGHTPGSVAVYVPLVGALFLGDAMTTRSVLTGEVGPRLAPFTLDPAAGLGVVREARRHRSRVGAARPRRRVDRWRRGGPAGDPGGGREGATAAGPDLIPLPLDDPVSFSRSAGWLARLSIAIVVASGCGSVPQPTGTPHASPSLLDIHVDNSTSVPMTVLVDGKTITTVAPHESTVVSAAGLPDDDWLVEVRLPSSRTIMSFNVIRSLVSATTGPQGQGGVTGTGRRADLTCGRLDVWVAVAPLGPPPGPGVDGTCS